MNLRAEHDFAPVSSRAVKPEGARPNFPGGRLEGPRGGANKRVEAPSVGLELRPIDNLFPCGEVGLEESAKPLIQCWLVSARCLGHAT